ncbi:MAG: AAA family ATPase [Chitinophagaceae bacterium]|nr:AAA family ATPase [Chitinophagaceae bacterium]
MKKIAIIGPESTGKSTLCKELATHYHTLWCPEFARGYLTEHGMDYTYDDLLTIAKGQVQQEEEYVNKAERLQMTDERKANGPILFIDTDMYVMKVWCEFVFGQCHQWILDRITERRYDLYLLCKPDLPWMPDPLREYPDEQRRQKLYHYYKDLLANQTTPWVEISGMNEERLKKAVEAVDQLLKN